MAVTLRGVISMETSKAVAAMRRLDRNVRRFDGQIAAPLRRATENLARFTAVAATAGTMLLGSGLKIAGTFDQVGIRLETVMGTAVEARQAFEETFQLFVRSPQYLMPLVEARTLLESFGVGGAAQLRAVADAAAIMGRDVRHVALALGSMETRPLRRLGIDAHKAGDAFEFNFRDKAGRALTYTAQGLDNARMQVLRILNIKFGGGLERMAKTWTGAMSTFVGAMQAVIHKGLGPLKDELIPRLMQLNNVIIETGLNGSSKLTEFGNALRDMVLPSVDLIINLVRSYNNLSTANRDQLNNMLKASAIFLVAYKAGFIKPLINLIGAVATGQWAMLAPMFKAIAAIAAFKATFDFIGAIRENIEEGTTTGADLWEAFWKRLKDPTTIIPGFVKNPIQDLIDGMNLPAMDSIPEMTQSGVFADDLGEAANAAARIHGFIAPLRGTLAGRLRLPSPDKAGSLPIYNRAAAMESEQRITNAFLGRAVEILKIIAEDDSVSVSFATP